MDGSFFKMADFYIETKLRTWAFFQDKANSVMATTQNYEVDMASFECSVRFTLIWLYNNRIWWCLQQLHFHNDKKGYISAWINFVSFQKSCAFFVPYIEIFLHFWDIVPSSQKYFATAFFNLASVFRFIISLWTLMSAFWLVHP